MLIADYSLGDAFLTIIWIFLFVAWILVLFTIVGDLFRDHQLSGWWKAVWIFFLIFVPFLTALVYLIARGHGMRERSIKEQAAMKSQFDSYVRETAGSSPADQLHKLSELKQRGDISEAEFGRAKAKLLA